MAMKTPLTASSVGVSLCALLLSTSPLLADERRVDRTGSFDVAQRGPDRQGSSQNNDQEDPKKRDERNKKADDGNDKRSGPGGRVRAQPGGDQPQGREGRGDRGGRDNASGNRGGQPGGAPDRAQDKRGNEPPRGQAQQPPPNKQPAAQQQITPKRDDSRDSRKDRDRQDTTRPAQGFAPSSKQEQPPRPVVTPPVKPGNDWEKRARDAQKSAPSTLDKMREQIQDGKKSISPPPRAAEPRGDDKRRAWRNQGFGFQDIQKQRKERAEAGGKRTIIEEPDKRVIVRDQGRVSIRHDEMERFRRGRGELREERRSDGSRVHIVKRPGGVEVVSILDANGRLIKRVRRSGGKEILLINNRPPVSKLRPGARRSGPGFGFFIDLPPPVIRIPRAKYIVNYDDASYDDIYEALMAPPVDRLSRGYSLDEIRESRYVRERMRRVDLDSINFNSGSWDVDDSQFPKLERIARAMNMILRRNPDVVFMIEGHTDAVGSEIDNLSLSDRRAETVASILTEEFDVPPENLVTQGYGEEFLKIPTQDAERANRRVAVLNITPLMGRGDRYSGRD